MHTQQHGNILQKHQPTTPRSPPAASEHGIHEQHTQQPRPSSSSSAVRHFRTKGARTPASSSNHRPTSKIAQALARTQRATHYYYLLCCSCACAWASSTCGCRCTASAQQRAFELYTHAEFCLTFARMPLHALTYGRARHAATRPNSVGGGCGVRCSVRFGGNQPPNWAITTATRLPAARSLLRHFEYDAASPGRFGWVGWAGRGGWCVVTLELEFRVHGRAGAGASSSMTVMMTAVFGSYTKGVKRDTKNTRAPICVRHPSAKDHS